MQRSEANRMRNEQEETPDNRREMLLLPRAQGTVTPLLCGAQRCEPGQAEGPVYREFYLLHFVMEGRGRFEVDQRQYDVKKNQLFVIRPGERVRMEADSRMPWTLSWIGFAAPVLGADANFVLNRQDVFTAPECRTMFREMTESTRLTSGLEMRLCGILWGLLAVLTDRCPEEEPSAADYVRRAKNYIHVNYAGDVSVQGIARSLGLSRSYFSAVFSKAEGVSPQEYLVDYRLRKAAELICRHGLRPGEAAAASGYTDVFTFSKMFKKKFGVPPGRYQGADSENPEE